MLGGGLLPFPRTGCVLYAKAIVSNYYRVAVSSLHIRTAYLRARLSFEVAFLVMFSLRQVISPRPEFGLREKCSDALRNKLARILKGKVAGIDQV